MSMRLSLIWKKIFSISFDLMIFLVYNRIWFEYCLEDVYLYNIIIVCKISVLMNFGYLRVRLDFCVYYYLFRICMFG